VALEAAPCSRARIWARNHNLLKMNISSTSLLSLRKGTPLPLQPQMALCTPLRQSSHDRLVVAAREVAKVTPKVLRKSGELTQDRGQTFLPA
jgi:hypothetical protein